MSVVFQSYPIYPRSEMFDVFLTGSGGEFLTKFARTHEETPGLTYLVRQLAENFAQLCSRLENQ